MLARLQKALKDKDQGFTLIELLVVIVIIGILAAIAIPLFLNQRQKGVDAGVQSDLKALATIEETHFTDKLAYTSSKTDTDALNFKVTDKNVIEVFVTTDGYCLRGSSAKGSKKGSSTTGGWYWYDSTAGGLKSGTAAPTGGICGTTPIAFTTVSPPS
jgi:type IV pilus assembly protein PilA